MDATLISALISGLVTLVVCVITNHTQNEKTRALLEYRMGVLEQKMDRHNNLQDRVLKNEINIKQLMREKGHESDD